MHRALCRVSVLAAVVVIAGCASSASAPAPAPAPAPDGHGRVHRTADIASVPFTTLDGATHTLGEYQGKRVLVDLWATWWGYCVAALDELHANRAELPADLVIITISGDADKATVDAFVKKRGWVFDVIACSEQEMDDPAFHAFNATKIPLQILIGTDGKVVARGHHLDLKTLLN